MNLSSAFGPSDGGIEAFDATPAAPEFTPLPAGFYKVKVVLGECCTTRAGTDGYRIRFEVADGPHAGKAITRIWTFGPRAIGYSKRDLAIFGLTTSAQLLSPFPPIGKEITCRLIVATQRGNDGIERNDIKKIDVLEVRDSPGSEFLIHPSTDADTEAL